MKQKLYFYLLIITFTFSGFNSFSEPSPGNLSAQFSAKDWIRNESRFAQARILDSMSQVDCAPGVVIASPSKETPNYYYHWVRDAALVMDVVVNFLKSEVDIKQKKFWQTKLDSFVELTRKHQASNAITGIGEPKFLVNGEPYNGAWGRPQNDGPALRAITLMRYGNILLDSGDENFVRQNLFDGSHPSNTLVKVDLEYVASHWRDSSFDLWEEVQGDHFYTRMVQRKALKMGSDFAKRLGDLGASDWYLRQANALEFELNKHWDAQHEFVRATLNWRAGLKSKNSNLDIAVILAAHHGGMGDGFFDFKDVRVLKTLSLLMQRFQDLYPINRSQNFPAVAIGRYPEDVYDGDQFKGGNPWVLTTLAVAEAFYKMAANTKDNPNLKDYYNDLISVGDSYVQRVAIHSNPDGSLSEQIDRHTGFMTSAVNLTWNYAAIMTAMWARPE